MTIDLIEWRKLSSGLGLSQIGSEKFYKEVEGGSIVKY